MNNKCENCKKVFSRIYELDRHKNRKNKCRSINQDINRTETILSSNSSKIIENANIIPQNPPLLQPQ